MLNNKLRYTKSEYINAYMWSYGMTKTKARQEVKMAIDNGLYGLLNAIADGFTNNAKLAFNCD